MQLLLKQYNREHIFNTLLFVTPALLLAKKYGSAAIGFQEEAKDFRPLAVYA